MRAFSLPEAQAAIDGASSPQDACVTIEPLFAELLADSGWLPDEYQAAAPESGMGGGIGQWLLYRADDGSLSLLSLVVPPGSETPIHDHLAWGLVGLYRGTQDEEILCAARRGARTRRAAIARAGRLLRPDPAARRHPPRADPSAETSVSIHLLTNDTGSVCRHAWDTASDQARPFRSGYVNVACDD